MYVSKNFEGTEKQSVVPGDGTVHYFSFKFLLINVLIFIYILPYSKTNLR